MCSRMERPLPLAQRPVPIVNIGHTSFQMKNEAAMLHFYGDILGMKNLFTLTMGDLMVSMEERMGDAESQEKLKEMSEEQRRELKQRKESMKAVADKPWITYMKLADRQYLELFYDMGRPMEHVEDRSERRGRVLPTRWCWQFPGLTGFSSIIPAQTILSGRLIFPGSG